MNRWILRSEGFAVFLGALLLYWLMQGSWMLFGALLFVPDFSMLGYLLGRQAGTIAYNLFHNYIPPIVLLGVGLWLQADIMLQIGLTWSAHIGMDRALGYGLKYPSGFQDTHLGQV